jgi:hypothetical protein
MFKIKVVVLYGEDDVKNEGLYGGSHPEKEMTNFLVSACGGWSLVW